MLISINSIFSSFYTLLNILISFYSDSFDVPTHDDPKNLFRYADFYYIKGTCERVISNNNECTKNILSISVIDLRQQNDI